MDPRYDLEIVEVVSECRLMSSDASEHVYWRRDGRPLVLGHYVVTRPSGPRGGRYNEDAQFKGPYRERAEAQKALERLKKRTEADRSGPMAGITWPLAGDIEAPRAGKYTGL